MAVPSAFVLIDFARSMKYAVGFPPTVNGDFSVGMVVLLGDVR
jgi:hypothetical protein